MAVISGSYNLYSLGHLPASGNMSLYMPDPITSSARMSLYLKAGDPSSGTLPLFLWAKSGVSGVYETIPLYVSQLDEPSGTYTTTSASGLNLFITNSGETQTASLNLTLRVDKVYSAEGSGINNDITFYMSGPILASSIYPSGTMSSPAGVWTGGGWPRQEQWRFVKPSGELDTDSTDKYDTSGYYNYPIGADDLLQAWPSSISLFIKAAPVISGIMNLVMGRATETKFHNPSLDLYLKAPENTSSGNINLTTDAHVAATGNMDFVISNTHEAPSGTTTLYTHGF